MENNFVKRALLGGGSLHPLLIPPKLTSGLGLMNPSVFNDNGKIIVNIRVTNYCFYHSESKVFQHPWGPLTYLHPENDMHLRTRNFYCEMTNSLDIDWFTEIDMKKFDTYEPKWDFVGLEDARIFRWDGKLYISGVRRDTTTNGEGRMELSEIVKSGKTMKEVSRFRIPPPKDLNSYCEKNWMPIIDMPMHYVKWTAPTEVVKIDPTTQGNTPQSCKTVCVVDNCPTIRRDLRGGSQVIPCPWLPGHRMTVTHEVDLFKSEVGRKDAVYHHRFVIWDKDWNVVKFSREFFMMDAHVEFGVGMCLHNNGDMLITFGFQDNAAFLLRVPSKTIQDFISSCA